MASISHMVLIGRNNSLKTKTLLHVILCRHIPTARLRNCLFQKDKSTQIPGNLSQENVGQRKSNPLKCFAEGSSQALLSLLNNRCRRHSYR